MKYKWVAFKSILVWVEEVVVQNYDTLYLHWWYVDYPIDTTQHNTRQHNTG